MQMRFRQKAYRLDETRFCLGQTSFYHEKTTDGEEIEVAIWINMQTDSDYRETLVHLSSPEIRNGKLYEPKYYDLF